MKKPKLSFGEGGFKGLALRHVEKVVAVGVLAAVAALLYYGVSSEGLKDEREPDKLAALADKALNQVNLNSSQEIFKEVHKDTNFPARAEKSLTPTRDESYALVRPLIPPEGPPQEKRRDPKLYAPEKPLAVPFRGAVAWTDRSNPVDPLASLKNASRDGQDEAKRKRRDDKSKKKSRKGGGGMGMPGMAGAGGGGMAGMAGMAGAAGGGGMPGMAGAGGGGMAGMAGMAGAAGGGGMPGMAGAGGGMTGMPGAAGASWMLPPRYRGTYAPGAPAAVSPSPETEDEEEEKPVNPAGTMAVHPRSGIMITALVPFDKQHAEYESQFANAAGYDASRDFPIYVAVQVQRVEIATDDAPVDEAAWVDVDTFRARQFANFYWGSVIQEIANPDYLDATLTYPVPPMVLTDLTPFLTREEIPLLQSGPAPVAKPATTSGPESPDDLLPGAAKAGPSGSGPGGMMGGGMMGGGMSSGPGGMMGGGAGGMMGGGAGGMGGGMASGPGAMGGGMSSGPGGMMGGGAGGMASGPGAMMGGGMSSGPGGMMGGMAGGMMGGGVGIGRSRAIVKHKLVRYFDFDAEPGKKYRYRLRVALDDPNNPESATRPEPRILEPEVTDRISQAAAQRGEREKHWRDYFVRRKVARVDDKMIESLVKTDLSQRLTDWSEPTAPVSLSANELVFAGAAVPADTRILKLENNREVRFTLSEPAGKMVPVVWDSEKAVHVPAESDVTLGSVLNLQTDCRVPHPLELAIKLIEGYNLVTNSLVVDIRGGEPLDETRDALTAPGEFAVIDKDGRLIVQYELDQIEEYRRFTYAEDEKPETKTREGAAADPEGGMPGMQGMPGGGMPGGMGPMGPMGPMGGGKKGKK